MLQQADTHGHCQNICDEYIPRHDIRVNRAANMTSPSGEVRQPGGTLNTLLSSKWWDTKQAYIAIAVGTNRSCTVMKCVDPHVKLHRIMDEQW